MKTSPLLSALPLALFLIAGCSQNAAQEDLLRNPLYSRFYYQDLANHMADYSIQNDPILKDAEKKGIIESTRSRAVEHIANANALINAGKKGGFMSDTEYAAGTALLSGGTVYFSQDFNTLPGPSVRVYASTLLDPRGESGSVLPFPDESAVDLGPLKSPYMAQSYVIPAEAKDTAFRSIVLWDTRLERLFGFAQFQQ